MAYTLIATQTLLNPTATVSFNGIPQGFKDLVLEITGTSGSTASGGLQFNNDASALYSETYMYGTGTSAGSLRHTVYTFAYNWVAASSASGQFTAISHIMSYSNSSVYKTTLSRSSQAGYEVDAFVSLWRSSNAITSLTALMNATNFLAGSTFKLWGVS